MGAAIYLNEYAGNKKVVAVIEYAAETLSGIPSIIYGLVGMLFFCQFLDMQTSLLAGALGCFIDRRQHWRSHLSGQLGFGGRLADERCCSWRCRGYHCWRSGYRWLKHRLAAI